ncbi:drug resistance transporter, EmrB/QacA subfamily [Synechococcus sp. PCC 7502]|uniref:MDR family MFS transporter n=1 Tax=Synechococcus sp. PCC 7502 TaxID=1173263 RepID=UPI00029FC2CC|nr:MDR family MFS transporter [Synechococcus sp. PCC 7502]AFY74509.1 drug resistance transporter, EmrB/QacA subfamily [Synechococcus sp. PCC 7502]
MANPSTPKNPDAVSIKTWIGVIATLIGGFMAILDIQITNASLNEIAGSLSATLDEASWISTSYLVAEIVVIPLTGWLSQVFSVRRYLLVNASLFLIFSVLCAFATNLPQMILYRTMQGFTVGVLIPISFTVILTTLPPVKQPVGQALFGMSAVLAPSLGPTLGGWLTDTFSWQYIFYLNVFPAIILLAGVWYGLAQKPLRLELLKQGDWLGIALMAFGLGSLEFFLEEGNRKDWFSSQEIQVAGMVAAIALPLFVITQFMRKQPLLNLRLLGRRNFGLSSIIAIALGLGLYGSIYILPLYLAQIQGYNALQIGQTLVWIGFPQLAIVPFLPKLMKRFDIRHIICVGLTLFGTSCLMNSSLTHDTGAEQFVFPLLVRALGQPLTIIPLASIATVGIEPQNIGSASAIFNAARNLGGSIGIAVLATLQSVREKFHSNHLVESVSLANLPTQERINDLTNLFISKGTEAITAHDQAIAQLDRLVRREANVMAYNDCFLFIGYSLLFSAVLVLFLRKVKPATGAVH